MIAASPRSSRKEYIVRHPNALAGGIAGAVTVILVWIAGELGLVVPVEVASAFTTLVTVAVLLAAGPKEV